MIFKESIKSYELSNQMITKLKYIKSENVYGAIWLQMMPMIYFKWKSNLTEQCIL